MNLPDSCAYHGGESFRAIGTSFDNLCRHQSVISADVLDAWFEPAPSVVERVNEFLPFLLRSSPPTYADGLREAIAKARGIPPECIVTGAGSSDLIFRTLPRMVTSRALLLDPTYSEYEYVLSGRVVKFPVRRENGFRLDPDEFIAAIRSINPGSVILVNPANPTGRHMARADLLRIIDSSPALFVVDEAYIDYIDAAESVEREVAHRRNLVVIKSMSKVYALSGARVAYLAAHREVISGLAGVFPPWGVSLPAQVAAVEALKCTAYYRQQYKATHELRRACVEHTGPVRVYDTDLNFYLVEVPDAGALCDRLKCEHIYTRIISADLLRITVKDRATNDIVLAALRRATSGPTPSTDQACTLRSDHETRTSPANDPPVL